MKSIVCGAVVACLHIAQPALAQFPKEGVAGIANGTAAPFVGTWSIGFPEGDGMIAGEDLVGCDRPVGLRATSETSLDYLPAAGDGPIPIDLSDFAGRTSWFTDTGSAVAVWTGPDAFFLYQIDPATGGADWDDPRIFRRCG